MLARDRRVVTAAEFKKTVRRGRRITSPHTVVYALHGSAGGNARFGFIVSKAVGNAVLRNRLRRRLRAITAEMCAAENRAAENRAAEIGTAGMSGLSSPGVNLGNEAMGEALVVLRMLPGAASLPWQALRSEVCVSVARGVGPS